ncbi:peptidase domain-containing ABC transporter [Stenotrophomonas sp. CFBP 13725]|uniref:peptidase domain-containing ABC transporter n=1 Tax=Stenotrophomonas sp. CFBP 13725 TaxID=2775297 RepID=UPI00177C4D59|nr:peptidase domain-containing ABC transporter [Stenotrophomonas sp. CFBP 13725]MBD8634292.1 peptidase domain-containing ABC transporter [Stenotrophomonas sp. CFBP 13725]
MSSSPLSRAAHGVEQNAQAAFQSELRFGWRRVTPLVLQAEAAECGLACLAMVAGHYGHYVDLVMLRTQFGLSQNGATLKRIMQVASSLSMESRALKIEMEKLDKLRLPCILHWDMSHFVVLCKIGARGAVVHDPSRGIRRLSMVEVSRHFTGVALELIPATDFRRASRCATVSLRSMLGTIRGLIPVVLQILGLALSLETFILVGPFYLQWTVDQVIISSDRDLLTLLSAGFAIVAFFQILFTSVRAWIINWMGAITSLQWGSNIVGHLLRLPLSWFEKRHVGDIVSRLASIQAIQSTLTTQFIGSLLDGFMSFLTLLIMANYSVRLASMVVGMFLLYVLLRCAFFGPLWRANEDQLIYASRLQSDLLESIRGILPIKLANQHDARRARYSNATVQVINRGTRIQQLNISFGAANGLIFGLGRVVLIWGAALLVMEEEISVGMMVAFVAFADMFISRSTALADKWVDFRMLRLHAERLADIALSEPEAADGEACCAMPEDSSIEVRNVSFRYSDGDPWVLKNCSLRVESGCSIAITGPSGCGKTTLAKIMLGLLTPTEGEVIFGGRSIGEVGLGRFRSVVGAVMQDDQLFAGTIGHNISFGDPDSNDGRIREAAELAAVNDDIQAMPMGYRTLVGDMGSSLSGGQKQLVILARALYRRPRLLVLDEATSHLDLERERRINAAVRALTTTRVVIAHRPETVQSADEMYEMTREG